MKKNILVIGGNRFFGKQLVQSLVNDGHLVTVMNRGRLPNIKGTQSLICDRTIHFDLIEKTKNKFWDIIYDQVCFTHFDSALVNEILKSKTNRYVMISSQSVYGLKANLTESDFDPYNYKFSKPTLVTEDYAESKRQAEATLIQHQSGCMSSFVRLPFVLGEDDYTHRLKYHIDAVLNKKEIYFPNLNAFYSVIQSKDAAANILKLGFLDHEGPINLACALPLQLKNLISMIESEIGYKALLTQNESPENGSPYGVENDWYMNTDLAQKLKLTSQAWSEWLPLLIRFYLKVFQRN